LCQLSVFQTDFDVKAARVVAQSDEPLQDALDQLWRRSLLEWDANKRCYRLHDLVRTFAAQHLRDASAAHRRAGAYYARQHMSLLAAQHLFWAGDYVEAAVPLIDTAPQIINQGNVTSLRNLLSSLAGHKTQLGDDRWVQIKMTCGDAWRFLGRGRYARRCYSQVLHSLRNAPDTTAIRTQRARALRGLSEALEARSLQAALDYVKGGLRVLRGADTMEKALLHLREGSVYMALCRFDEAIGALKQCQDLLPMKTDVWYARALVSLGGVYCCTGDLEQGRLCFEEARLIYERVENNTALAGALQNLASIALRQGDWFAAQVRYHEALRIAEHIGDIHRCVQIDINLGILMTRQRRYARAEDHLDRAAKRTRQHSLHEDLIAALASLADLVLREGDVALAEQYLHEAEVVRLELGSEEQLPELLWLRAEAALARGNLREALGLAQSAQEKAQVLQMPFEEGVALRVLGTVLLRDSQQATAITMFEDSLLQDTDSYEYARTQHCLAQALETTDPVRSQQLLATVTTVIARLGIDIFA